MDRTVRRLFQIGLFLIVCVGIAFFVYRGMRSYKQKEARLQSWLDTLEEEIQPYQNEIDALEKEIEAATEAYDRGDEYGRVIPAYYVYEPEDIMLAEEEAALVFDCTWEDDMLYALAESGHELIMLYSSAESDKIAYDQSVTGVTSVILPGNKQDRDSVELLEDLGFEVLFGSQNSTETGYYEDNTVRMPYIYINDSSYDLSKYLNALIDAKDVFLLLFDIDIDSIGINNYLDVLREYEDEGTIESSTVEDQTEYVKNRDEIEAARQAQFETLIAEKQARIDELNRLIAAAFDG